MGNAGEHKVEKYKGIYADFANLLGEEAVKKIYDAMKGQQITFPKMLHTREYIVQETKNITDPKELKKVATYYGYTERRLKQLLKQEQKIEERVSQ